MSAVTIGCYSRWVDIRPRLAPCVFELTFFCDTKPAAIIIRLDSSDPCVHHSKQTHTQSETHAENQRCSSLKEAESVSDLISGQPASHQQSIAHSMCFSCVSVWDQYPDTDSSAPPCLRSGLRGAHAYREKKEAKGLTELELLTTESIFASGAKQK